MTEKQEPGPLNVVPEELKAALADRYRVESVIGRGGMATVYGAWDIKHERKVAIKVLSPDLASAIGSERFAREVKVAARLSHPNILAVFDSGAVGDLLYYVMPFVAGESLRDKLDREKQLSIDTAIDITCDVASALGYAHAQNVVHRDVKPENILLQDGHVLVADFGIARGAERTDERLTGTGMSLGTAAYMAPEQAAGEKVDARADIYALGCTLFEMLAGHPPFTGANPMALMARHSLEPVPSIRIVRSTVPEELEDAIVRAMAKVPADRFQTMSDFKRAILGEAVAGGGGATSRYTARYRTATAKPARTTARRVAEISIAALLVAAAAFGGKKLVDSRVKRGTGAVDDSNARRIAVLYFEDQGNGSLRYLADGLTESLIDRLSAVAALDVISRDGVRAFRGKDVPDDSVGKALQVGSIVRGSVEPNGGKVKITVRLQDAGSGGVDFASKSFIVDTAQALAAQDTLATEVANFLRDRLGTEFTLRDDRRASGNSQAWTLVERAEKLRKDADSLSAAGADAASLAALAAGDSLLASAAQLDAQWSKIPARRAMLMYLRARQLAKQPQLSIVALDSGLAEADRALALQPNSADAYEIKGELQYLRFQQRVDTDPREIDRLLPAAESSLTKSVELNRDQAGAWAALSSLYYSKPDIQAANGAALSAYRADAYLALAKPVLKRLFSTSHDLEHFPEALKWCNEGKRRFPADPYFTECRLLMYTTTFEKPNIDSAWLYRAKYVSLEPAAEQVTAAKMGDILVAGALARVPGLADSARRVLLRARATPAQDPQRELEGFEAVIRVILNDKDEAVRLLADYLAANPAHRKGFATRTGWWWRDLQGNPKFQALLAGAR